MVGISRWRKLDPHTVPIEAKAAANYLNGMVARSDARRRGFDFALMCDTEGYIAEGAAESIFLVQGGTLLTPALGSVLDGITRRSLLEVARTERIDVSKSGAPMWIRSGDRRISLLSKSEPAQRAGSCAVTLF